MGVKKIYLTYDDVDSLLDKIYEQVEDEGFKQVTGIPRGGTILAILYSHKYGIKYTHNIVNESDLLVLDDIADSGATLKKESELYPDVTFATLHYKAESVYEPEYYAKYIIAEYGWVVYPWEQSNSNPIQDYLEN